MHEPPDGPCRRSRPAAPVRACRSQTRARVVPPPLGDAPRLAWPNEHRIFVTSVGSVYPHYVAKAERRGRGRAEVDEIIRGQTGYDPCALDERIGDGTDFRTFFEGAPSPNPARDRVTGVICGVRVMEIADPLMREIRILDRMVGELARGMAMDRILRTSPSAPGPESRGTSR